MHISSWELILHGHLKAHSVFLIQIIRKWIIQHVSAVLVYATRCITDVMARIYARRTPWSIVSLYDIRIAMSKRFYFTHSPPLTKVYNMPGLTEPRWYEMFSYQSLHLFKYCSGCLALQYHTRDTIFHIGHESHSPSHDHVYPSFSSPGFVYVFFKTC